MHTPTRGARDAVAVAHIAVLVAAAVLGYVVVFNRELLIPEHFYADGFFIQAIALGVAEGDVKYANTATVYAAFGLAEDPVLASFLGYSAALAVLALAWLRGRGVPRGWAATATAALAILLSAVYLGWYSKDVLVLAVTVVFLLARPGRIGWALCVATAALYAWLFRDYWYLVAGLFIGISLIGRWLTPLRALLIAVGATAVASAAIVLALGVSADAFRTGVNESRLEMDVGTIITPFVALPEPLGGIVNNVLTLLALWVPLPVAVQGGAYYLGIAAVILVLWALFAVAIRPGLGIRSQRAIALVLAFVAVQAVFEPDYGSALRHLTPLLPLFVWVIREGSPAALGGRRRAESRIATPLRPSVP